MGKMKCTKMELDIVIIPEGTGEDKVFSVSCIQVPNVVTQGDSVEEAKQMLKEALELYFEEVPEEKKKVIQTFEIQSDAPLLTRIAL